MNFEISELGIKTVKKMGRMIDLLVEPLYMRRS